MGNIDINDSVTRMRQYFKNQKAASFPIKGHPLEKSDNYVKGMYMEMLCVILQYGNMPKEEQILFVKRLMEGLGVAAQFNECMRRALQADETFAGEFVKEFKYSKLKYNFIVDSFILIASAGTPQKYSVELVSEICEMLLINKKEVNFLVNVALSILEQKSDIYMNIEDKKLAGDLIDYFMCYFKEFFVGKLIDTKSEIYYFAKEKVKLDLQNNDEDSTEYKQDKITFENYVIDLSKINVKFTRCEYIQFINCDFIGAGPVTFENCKNINIVDCNFNDFTRGVLELKSCYNITIYGSKFKNCGKVGYSDVYGGVIYSDSLNQITIKSCKFNDCFVKCGNGYDRIYGIVFYGGNSTKSINIENNDFGYFDIKRGTNSEELFCGVDSECIESKGNTIFNDNMKLV